MNKESKAIGRKAAGSYGRPRNANKRRGYNAKRAGNKAIRKAGKNYEV
jgi:hypothetical protein|tara:strand:+ start:3623 stop:3766 length:144 start_codon:yes stop_codon:yes gene_type:complete